MKELFAAHDLEEFMLRLDRFAPLLPIIGEFDLLLAAATLAAHLDFAAKLNLQAAPASRRRQIEQVTCGLRYQTMRFRTGLMMFWLSGTLSSSSKSRQEASEWAGEAYRQALQLGRTLMALAIPCSTGWYDATVGGRQCGGSRPIPGAASGRRARV
jgi:hypothetical protein